MKKFNYVRYEKWAHLESSSSVFIELRKRFKMNKQITLHSISTLRRRLISIVLTVCLIVSIDMSFPNSSFAAQNDGSTNTVNLSLIQKDITITNLGSNIIAKDSDGTVLAMDNLVSGKIVLTGESEGYAVTASGNSIFNIELDGAVIDDAYSFTIENNTAVNLNLLNNNNITQGIELSGVASSLIISGSGALIVGGINIHGSYDGNITILSGTIVSTSSINATEVDISGGNITCEENFYSDSYGIIGTWSSIEHINISDGIINANLAAKQIDITGGVINSDYIGYDNNHDYSHADNVNITAGFVSTSYVKSNYIMIDGGNVWIKNNTSNNPLNSAGKNVYPVAVPATYAGESFIGSKSINVNLDSYYYEAKTTPGKNISSTVAGYIYLPVGKWNSVSIDKFEDGYVNVVKSITDSKVQNIVLWDKSKDFKYPLTFNANGGKVTTTTKTVSYGFAYGTIPTPTRSKYAFDGWYTSKTAGTKVTSSAKVAIKKATTLYAHWLPQYTVTLSVNGGKNLSKAKSKLIVVKSKTYGTITTPTRSKYSFAGWYTKKSGGTKVTKTSNLAKNANHTLYAHWAKPKQTIKFNANKGSVKTKAKTVTYNKKYGKLPTPVRKNYKFLGWYTKKSGGTKITKTSSVDIEKPTTLYAHWQSVPKFKI
jgi:uncharacterized repeat protein (TIGR02543 family)